MYTLTCLNPRTCLYGAHILSPFIAFFEKATVFPSLARTLMLRVHVTFSKTIQFGQRELVIPIPGNEDEAMDPVRHLRALFLMCPCPAESPAFSYSKDMCITYTGFTTSLKQLLRKAGYDPSLYTGHSFRRGGATLLYKLGVSILQIQASGDWSSQCFARYLYVSEEERLKVQTLGADAISSGWN